MGRYVNARAWAGISPGLNLILQAVHSFVTVCLCCQNASMHHPRSLLAFHLCAPGPKLVFHGHDAYAFLTVWLRCLHQS